MNTDELTSQEFRIVRHILAYWLPDLPESFAWGCLQSELDDYIFER